MKRRIAILTMAVIALAAFMVTTGLSVIYHYGHHKAAVLEKSKTQTLQSAERLGRNAEMHLTSQLGYIEEELLFSVIRLRPTALLLIDPDGRILLAHDNSLKGKQAVKHISKVSLENIKRSMRTSEVSSMNVPGGLNEEVIYPFVYPATQGELVSNKRGVIYIARDVSDELEGIKYEILREQSTTILIGGIFGVFLIAWFYFRVSRPLKALTQLIEKGKAQPDEFCVLENSSIAEVSDLSRLLRINAQETADHILIIEAAQQIERESYALSQAIFDDSPHAMDLINPQTLHFQKVNQSSAAMLGYTVTERMSQTMGDIVVHMPLKEVRAWVNNCIESGKAQFYVDLRKKDGVVITVRADLRLIKSRGKDYVLCIWNDISLETAAREQQTQLLKLKAVVEQSPLSVFIMDRTPAIEYANPEFTRQTGYELHEVLGKHPKMLAFGNTPTWVYDAMWSAIERGETWKGELRNRRKDGSEFIDLTQVAPIRKPDGSISHFLCIKEDVTEKRYLQKELERCERELKNLLANRSAVVATDSESNAVEKRHIIEAAGVPVVSGAGSSRKITGTDAPKTSISGKRVLLVEDNPQNQEVAREMLFELGLEVDLAEDGEKAVEMAYKAIRKNRLYDAILMDVQMPRMDGISATKILRSFPELSNTPILAMTANAFKEDRDACLSAGMNDHIAKPVDPKKFFALIRHWMPGVKAPSLATDTLVENKDIKDRLAKVGGLDIKFGLKSCMGRMDLYLRLLRAFRDSQDMLNLKRAIDAADYEKAHHIIHAFKGVSATVGAMDLSKAAMDLERNLKTTDRDVATIKRAAERIESNFKRLRNELGLSLPPEETPLDVPAYQPPQDVRALLSELETLLKSSNMAVVKLIREHANTLHQVLGPEMETISQHIEQFDFDDALAVLQSVTSSSSQLKNTKATQ